MVTTGEERDRLFNRTAEAYPFFADHQARISRQIPVAALVRAQPGRGDWVGR